MKYIIYLIMLSLLGACGGGPGAPLLRVSHDDGEGPLVPNCKNVSKNSMTDHYITHSYLSTWLSAFREGIVQGVAEGADSVDIMRNQIREKNR